MATQTMTYANLHKDLSVDFGVCRDPRDSSGKYRGWFGFLQRWLICSIDYTASFESHLLWEDSCCSHTPLPLLHPFLVLAANKSYRFWCNKGSSSLRNVFLLHMVASHFYSPAWAPGQALLRRLYVSDSTLYICLLVLLKIVCGLYFPFWFSLISIK